MLPRTLADTIITPTKTVEIKHRANTSAPQFTRTYLWITAFVTAGLGLGLLIFPSWIAQLFFIEPGADTIFFVRMVGSMLIGYAALNAMAARDGTYKICKAAVWSNLVTLLIAAIVVVRYQQIFNNFGWLMIGQHVVFAAGFIYCARQLSRSA